MDKGFWAFLGDLFTKDKYMKILIKTAFTLLLLYGIWEWYRFETSYEKGDHAKFLWSEHYIPSDTVRVQVPVYIHDSSVDKSTHNTDSHDKNTTNIKTASVVKIGSH